MQKTWTVGQKSQKTPHQIWAKMCRKGSVHFWIIECLWKQKI